ncbi:uncharacterized protein K452DRAFT_269300 [Aplosporella prunicola CBS 121167]|uniref:Tryptophan--tRNA ligase, mitochondrial n=1 Tax=Aplosporella prunicola CBS 121167 TaxID=1176127 RepID=A0A6A6BGU3_9PEZI|nr:uncharacterized protein K452DRAFT_269300 [Aplosporella prunicola CBS 121167]KAF2142818.1 hypothetical protein K452DRAFT_269300 [Aplosporella prunicola CBS 121167]
MFSPLATRSIQRSPGRVRSLRCLSTASPPARPKVIFSGIQPTGVPHLGNYLGALQQWTKLQNEAAPEDTLIYSIVDLHAITNTQSPHKLRQCRTEMMASLLAIGLDPKRSTIFQQSAVPAHSELMWILSTQASVGYLSRMTQWKSKLSLPENASPLDPTTKAPLKLGLFSYPVLQAADILIHRATHVPVGEDQLQHLEFARECARTFNFKFRGRPLVMPRTILSPAKRVMSLADPTKKMSKSDSLLNSRILITDTEDEIWQKIRSAKTDSIKGVTYDPEARPGVSNLVEILFNLDNCGASSCEELANHMKDYTLLSLKQHVNDVVNAELEPIRSKYNELISKDQGKALAEIAHEGAQKASASAAATMKIVKEAIGLD